MRTITTTTTPTFTSSLSVPGRNEPVRDDADATLLRALLQNTKYLHMQAFAGSGARYKMVPTGRFSNDNTIWYTYHDNVPILFAATASSQPSTAEITDLVPYGGTFSEFRVSLYATGSHSALPANMPSVALTRCGISDLGSSPSKTTIASATDSSATYLDLQADHDIAAIGLSEACNPHSYRYFLEITGENGANSQNGLTIYRVSFSVTG